MSSGAEVSASSFQIDFDHWATMAAENPQGFFEARRRLIDEFIASAPEVHRESLVQLQGLIDGTRLEAGTPLNALRQIMAMMGDHLHAIQSQLIQLGDESRELAENTAKISQ